MWAGEEVRHGLVRENEAKGEVGQKAQSLIQFQEPGELKVPSDATQGHHERERHRRPHVQPDEERGATPDAERLQVPLLVERLQASHLLHPSNQRHRIQCPQRIEDDGLHDEHPEQRRNEEPCDIPAQPQWRDVALGAHPADEANHRHLHHRRGANDRRHQIRRAVQPRLAIVVAIHPSGVDVVIQEMCVDNEELGQHPRVVQEE
mmetsp:Transcript_47146/g.131601  ORF Transcript_47146/g.131601 Transcript_47146/m.131601 type:complete len:205 (-) Transcript_47146:95-709(-)